MAFTLSETLIALVIIGVVAVMTVFVLQATIENEKRKSAFKKAYNTLVNATNKFKYENGGDMALPDISSTNYQTISNTYMEEYSKYMNANVKCYSVDDCFDKEVWYRYTPSSGTYYMAGFRTPDGVSWRFYIYDKNCSYTYSGPIRCGEIQFDINGPKPPNKQGKDIWPLIIDIDGKFTPFSYLKNSFDKMIAQ